MRSSILATLALVFILFAAFSGCAQQGAAPQQQTANTQKTGENMSINPANATSNGKTVEKGDTLKVDYVGKLTDGTVFDTSIKSEAEKAGLPSRPSYSPLEFKVGAGQLIEGFDSGVLGMKEGETKVVTMPPEKAYGLKRDDAIISIPLEKIGNSSNIKVGSILYAQNGASGKVVEITNATAKIDFNPELAGQTLVFTIKVISITKG
jgi:FKBP-type peptidyl-prolyl cis-trans isomerase 2